MCVSAYVHMYNYTCTQMYTPTKGIYYYRLYRSYKYQSCLYCTNVCSCCYFRGSITSSCLCYMWLFFSVMSYRELAGWTALLPLLRASPWYKINTHNKTHILCFKMDGLSCEGSDLYWLCIGHLLNPTYSSRSITRPKPIPSPRYVCYLTKCPENLQK